MVEQPRSEPTRHALNGYVVQALPPLRTVAPCAEASGPLGIVTLRAATVPEHLGRPSLASPNLEISAGEVLLKPFDGARPLGRMLVRGGREIIVEPQPGAELELEPYVLGSGVGAICLQNELLPLHVSAVDFGGGAIAFAGDSGAGKSTMAAALAGQGGLHVTDDVAVLKIDAAGAATTFPGPRTFKLSPDSYGALGLHAGQGERLSPYHDKMRFISPVVTPPSGSIRLEAIYLLEFGDGEDVVIEPVTGAQATASIARQIYRSAWLAPMEVLEGRMRDVAILARRTPCFRLRRPRDLDRLPLVAEAVRKHHRAAALKVG